MTVTILNNQRSRSRKRPVSALLALIGLLLTIAAALAPSASAAGTNLLPSNDGTVTNGAPAGWSHTTGTGTTFSVVAGHTGPNALRVDKAGTTNVTGAWSPDAVPVTAGTSYTFTVGYQSTGASEYGVDRFTSSGGYAGYTYLGDLPTCATWCTVAKSFPVPSGTTSVSPSADIYGPGFLVTDDLSLTSGTVTPPPTTPANVSTTPGTVTNGGLETVDATSKLPTYWAASSWGTNTGSTVTTAVAHSGSTAVLTTNSAYTSGARNLVQQVPVTPGQTYKVSAFVATNLAGVQLGVQGESALNTETSDYYAIGTAPTVSAATSTAPTSAASYGLVSGSFTASSTMKYAEVFVPLNGKGWTAVDDFTMSLVNAPTSLSQGLVTVTFDDGWRSQYNNGRPIMNANHLPATYYLIGNTITAPDPDYMTTTQMKTLYTEGNEIGNHTFTHPTGGLKGLTPAQIASQFDKTTAAIKSIGLPAPTTCAYPEGTYDANVLAAAGSRYKACRSVDTTTNTYGANVPGAFAADSQYKLRIMDVNITIDTPPSYVKAGIDYAKANKAWVIFNFHEVSTAANSKGGDSYYTTPTQLSQEMAYLATSGVPVQTLSGAYDTVAAQLPAPATQVITRASAAAARHTARAYALAR